MSYHAHIEGTFTLDRPLSVEHKVTLEKFAEERHDNLVGNGYPWCQWRPTEDGTGIEYTEDEVSVYDFDDWLEYLVETFLAPWGYVLNGRIDYHGEDLGSQDLGAIFVKDNEVRRVEAEIVIRDPFA